MLPGQAVTAGVRIDRRTTSDSCCYILGNSYRLHEGDFDQRGFQESFRLSRKRKKKCQEKPTKTSEIYLVLIRSRG